MSTWFGEPAATRAVTLKNAGNELLRQHHYESAAAQYRAALKIAVPDCMRLPGVLLSNIAAAFWQLDKHSCALVCASSAMSLPRCIDSTHAKVYFRAAKAAEAMGFHGAALFPLAVLHNEFGAIPGSEELARRLRLRCEFTERSVLQQDKGGSRRGLNSKGSVGERMFARALMHAIASGELEECMHAPSAEPPMTEQQVLQLKEEGNEAFGEAQHLRAIGRWSFALSAFDLVPILHSNLAAACLKTKSHVAVVIHAAAVLGFRPCDAKALERAACAARQLDWLEEASACIARGVRLHPGDQNLQKQLRLLKSTDAAATGDARHDQRGIAITARQAREIEDEYCVTAHELRRRRGVFDMLLATHPDKMREFERAGGSSPSELDKEFAACEATPPGCTGSAVTELLRKASDGAFMWWVTNVMDPKDVNSVGVSRHCLSDPTAGNTEPGQIATRMRGFTPERFRWFYDSHIGEVDFSFRNPYNSGLHKLQSFCNAAQHALPMPLTGTHVAIGFVDLGELAETLAAQNETESQGTAKPALKWVGMDRSAHACAKAMVLLHMLKAGVHPSSAAQVWYSVGWTGVALQDFHQSVDELLQDPSMSASGGEVREVRRWLSAWRGALVPLPEARRLWMDRKAQNHVNICNLLRHSDRMAACRYLVAGDVPCMREGEVWEPTTGSVVMFTEPKRSSTPTDYTMDEDFLITIPCEMLTQQWRRAEDVVAAGCVLAARRCAALQSALQSNHLSCEIWNTVLSHDTPELIATMSGLDPTSMTWSNVPDYMAPSSFHRLAQSCAARGTPHFLHTMNWPVDVKGARMIDYSTLGDSPTQVNKRIQILADSQSQILETYKTKGVAELLRGLPIDSPVNVCDGGVLYPLMLPTWIAAFCAQAPKGGDKATCEVLHAPQYWQFVRIDSVAQLELIYT